jgi:hypothetical protein
VYEVKAVTEFVNYGAKAGGKTTPKRVSENGRQGQFAYVRLLRVKATVVGGY